jgi:hypothetical protein
VRKLDFTPRSLEFLEFTSQPVTPHPPSSSSAPPLPRSSATAGCRAAPPEAPACLFWPPRVAPELAHRLTFFPLAPSAPRRPTKPPLCRRRLPPLTAAAALPAPPPAPAAPTRRLQAGRCPSSLPLAFSRALHVAPPLPELCPAATSQPSWLAPCVPLPPSFSGLRPSVVLSPSNLLFSGDLLAHRGQTTTAPPDPR